FACIRQLGLIALMLVAVPAFGASLELRFTVLERMIAAEVFTTDGRRYVGNTQGEKCKFAYLERPKLGAAGNRLTLRVHFTGKYALGMLGRCVGMGDDFDLDLSAQPNAHNGAIGFDQWLVTTSRDSYYIRRVKAALLQSISKDFRLEVKDQAKKMMESSNSSKAPFQQELKDFNLTDVRVTPDSLVLEVDFKLLVK
ncbi:MAG: hypothetical protein ABI824_15825, partial [Acidobacteriota bacterium]